MMIGGNENHNKKIHYHGQHHDEMTVTLATGNMMLSGKDSHNNDGDAEGVRITGTVVCQPYHAKTGPPHQGPQKNKNISRNSLVETSINEWGWWGGGGGRGEEEEELIWFARRVITNNKPVGWPKFAEIRRAEQPAAQARRRGSSCAGAAGCPGRPGGLSSCCEPAESPARGTRAWARTNDNIQKHLTRKVGDTNAHDLSRL